MRSISKFVFCANVALSLAVYAAEDRPGSGAAAGDRAIAQQAVLRGNVNIDVMLAAPAVVATNYDLRPGMAAAVGLISVPASLVVALINPFALLGVSYPVVLPLASQDFGTKEATIKNSITVEDYVMQIRDALRSHLSTGQMEGTPEYVLQVLISTYGLQARSKVPRVGDTDRELCLVTHALVTVTRGDRELLRETIDIGIEKRSADAPVPVCASLSKFAEQDGNYLRLAIRESADILTALTLSRVGGGR